MLQGLASIMRCCAGRLHLLLRCDATCCCHTVGLGRSAWCRSVLLAAQLRGCAVCRSQLALQAAIVVSMCIAAIDIVLLALRWLW